MVIDQKLAFNENVDHVYKEAQQQLFLLRKLTSLNVGPHILESGYRSLIKSVPSFNIVTWYGILTVKNRAKLRHIVSAASKLRGSEAASAVFFSISTGCGKKRYLDSL